MVLCCIGAIGIMAGAVLPVEDERFSDFEAA